VHVGARAIPASRYVFPMPIPPVAAPSRSEMRELSNGRWEACCGRCLARSTPITADDGAPAWVEAQRAGWSWYVSAYGGSGYPLCAECLKAGPTVPKRRTRKRK
jgi:hypothetical protein